MFIAYACVSARQALLAEVYFVFWEGLREGKPSLVVIAPQAPTKKLVSSVGWVLGRA